MQDSLFLNPVCCPTLAWVLDGISLGAELKALLLPYLEGAAQMVVVNLFDGLEVDHALEFCLLFVWRKRK